MSTLNVINIKNTQSKILYAIIPIVLAILLIIPTPAFACTGSYVGKDVSADGNAIIARSDDSNPTNKIISLEVVDRVENQPGRSIVARDNGYEYKYPDTTYKYFSEPRDSSVDDGTYGASCINEYGLAVDATVTSYLSPEIAKYDPLVDCGLCEDVMSNIVAATCKTAREAIECMGNLIKTDGNSECSIMMVADQDEAWYMEFYSGHQWAAIKMPTDKVAFFGNEFMLQTEYDQNNPETFKCSDELFSLPQQHNIAVMKDGKMSLCETYNGKDRIADYANIRTYMGHHILAPSTAGEYNTTKRYDLFYTPDKKVSLNTIFDLYRYRYEDTPYSPDNTGAENIRVVGSETQVSIHATQILNDAPRDICDVTWVCLANAEHSTFLPYFSLVSKISEFFQDTKIWGNKIIDNGVDKSKAAEEGLVDQSYSSEIYDERSAFVCFKRLCALAEQDRIHYGAGVKKFWQDQEAQLVKDYPEVINTAIEKYKNSKEDAINYINDYTINLQEDTIAKANTMYDELIWFIAGNTNTLKHDYSYSTLTMAPEKTQMPIYKPTMTKFDYNKNKLNNMHTTNYYIEKNIVWIFVSALVLFGLILFVIILIHNKKKDKNTA